MRAVGATLDDALRVCLNLINRLANEVGGDLELLPRVGRQSFCCKESFFKRWRIDADPSHPILRLPR
jgi:hypothetical protein